MHVLISRNRGRSGPCAGLFYVVTLDRSEQYLCRDGQLRNAVLPDDFNTVENGQPTVTRGEILVSPYCGYYEDVPEAIGMCKRKGFTIDQIKE